MHILTMWLSVLKISAAWPLIYARRWGQVTTKTKSNRISYAMKKRHLMEKNKKITRSSVSQEGSESQTQKNICLLAEQSHSHPKLQSSKYLYSFCLILESRWRYLKSIKLLSLNRHLNFPSRLEDMCHYVDINEQFQWKSPFKGKLWQI